MSEYNSLTEFTEAVKNRMESKYEAEVSVDELLIEKTNGSQSGLQRDDLYRFMIVLPTGENWEESDDAPSKLYAYVPSEVDQIADRPNVPSYELDSVSVSEVVNLVDEHAPEYEGEFQYED